MLHRYRIALSLFVVVAFFANPAQSATLVVSNTSDSGAGSLRGTLAAAAAGDTITFGVTGNIVLASTLSVAQTVTIRGPGAGSLTLSGAPTISIINLTAGTLNLSGITLANGDTSGRGGAVQVATGATLNVSAAVFNANRATNGAAISVEVGSTASVDSTTFSGNTATGVGGGAMIILGTATLSNSTFIGNTAPINGGALNTQFGGTATVINSTFSGNSSGGLGGAFSNLGTTNIYNSTLTGNAATGGAAIASGNTNVLLNNSVIADSSSAAFNPLSGAVSGSNNVFYNNSADDATGYGTTNFRFATSQPLGLLGNNGGLTQTRMPVAGGTAICAGSVALIPSGVTTDQRGLPRTGSFGACVDAGAAQFTQTPPFVEVPTLSSQLILVLGAVVALFAGAWLRRSRVA